MRASLDFQRAYAQLDVDGDGDVSSDELFDGLVRMSLITLQTQVYLLLNYSGNPGLKSYLTGGGGGGVQVRLGLAQEEEEVSVRQMIHVRAGALDGICPPCRCVKH